MGDEGVSEVVGQILMFGILSMVLILSLLSFNIAKETAQERVLATTADSVAQRVATLVVDTALFAEQFQDQSVRMESRLELPPTLENHGYTIDLDASRVVITIPSSGRTGTAPLFSAGSQGKVHICDQEAFDGSSVIIRVVQDSNYPDSPDGIANVDDANGVAQPLTDCPLPAASPESAFYVYLEPDP